MAEDQKPQLQPSQVAAIQEVTRLLAKMGAAQDYGEVVVKIEAGKPVWVEAHPKIRKRVG